MKLKFWGVRGSIPTPISNKELKKIFIDYVENFNFLKKNKESEFKDLLINDIKDNFNPIYGGNTTCVTIEFDNDIIIFDAGTGIRLLGHEIMEKFIQKQKLKKTSLFLTHVHWDHIQGFPFFIPNFIPGNKISIFGFENSWQTIREAFNSQMDNNYFPVRLKELKANLEFRDIFENEKIMINHSKNIKKSIFVENVKLNHPNGCLGYKTTFDKKSIVFATDTEHYYPPQVSLISLARDCDILILDAQYTEDEYSGKTGMCKQGWGHSTPKRCIELAIEANAKKLILTHHEPLHDSFFLNKMEEEAKKEAKKLKYKGEVLFAKEGMEIEL